MRCSMATSAVPVNLMLVLDQLKNLEAHSDPACPHFLHQRSRVPTACTASRVCSLRDPRDVLPGSYFRIMMPMQNHDAHAISLHRLSDQNVLSGMRASHSINVGS
jgi:hypothetical protein